MSEQDITRSRRLSRLLAARRLPVATGYLLDAVYALQETGEIVWTGTLTDDLCDVQAHLLILTLGDGRREIAGLVGRVNVAEREAGELREQLHTANQQLSDARVNEANWHERIDENRVLRQQVAELTEALREAIPDRRHPLG